MRVRLYLVSNSSSSSFICDACGERHSGWDMFASLYCITEDHGFCEECADDIYLEDCPDDDPDCWDAREITSEQCPVCKFEIITDVTRRYYLTSRYRHSDADVLVWIKETTGNRRRRKVYDHDYVRFVLQQEGLTLDEVDETIRLYGTYDKLHNVAGKSIDK